MMLLIGLRLGISAIIRLIGAQIHAMWARASARAGATGLSIVPDDGGLWGMALGLVGNHGTRLAVFQGGARKIGPFTAELAESKRYLAVIFCEVSAVTHDFWENSALTCGQSKKIGNSWDFLRSDYVTLNVVFRISSMSR